jgi:hypothetical protein
VTLEETKRKKLLEETARIMAASGVTIDVDDLMNVEQKKQETKKAQQEFRNAVELLLQREHYKHGQIARICGNPTCKQPFITTYCYHQFCSDACANAEFKAHYGVDPRKLTRTKLENPAWQVEPVAAVPAYLTKWLYSFAQDLIAKIEGLSQEEFDSLEADDPVPADLGSPVSSPGATYSSVDNPLEPLDLSPQISSRSPHSASPANPQKSQSTAMNLDLPSLDF